MDPRQDINGKYSTHGGHLRLGAGDVNPKAALCARHLFARYLALIRAKRVVDKYTELTFRVD